MGASGSLNQHSRCIFDIKYLVEKDEHAGATLLCNHSRDKSRVFVEGVEMFFEKMEKRTPGYPVPGEIDHIHASPPCQGYSMANRNGGKDDEKNNEDDDDNKNKR